MKPKIKIPKKDYDSSWFIISAFAFILIVFIISDVVKNKTSDFTAIATICSCSAFFLPIVFYYRNRYRYYAPKFRTIEVRSLMDMLALGEGKIYEVTDDHIIGFNLLLRCRELGSGEEYYVNLQVPGSEVDFFDFQKKLELFKSPESKYKLKLYAISFHRVSDPGDEKKLHVGYKFWALKSEEKLLFPVESLTLN